MRTQDASLARGEVMRCDPHSRPYRSGHFLNTVHANGGDCACGEGVEHRLTLPNVAYVEEEEEKTTISVSNEQKIGEKKFGKKKYVISIYLLAEYHGLPERKKKSNCYTQPPHENEWKPPFDWSLLSESESNPVLFVQLSSPSTLVVRRISPKKPPRNNKKRTLSSRR